MTTIAYRNNVIAFDSRITADDTILYDDFDKSRTVDGVTFVICGELSGYDDLIAAYFGTKPAAPNTDNAALVVDSGKIWCIGIGEDGACWRSPVMLDRPYALGSGSAYALAAMDLGVGAADAVQCAKARDPFSGGLVRTISIEARC